jgi:glucose-1-phosphate cytidylyltransferase
MKVVILCGGLGTRLMEETEFKPKPMVDIGHAPILWHIMKIYSHYGFNDFVLCLGYKGHAIKKYFLNYNEMTSDFTMRLNNKSIKIEGMPENWNVTCVDTGQGTLTGGRLKRIAKYIDDDNFLATYGDGVANIDVNRLVAHHMLKNKIATVTAVNPVSRFGEIDVASDCGVTCFQEKPIFNSWINGGFFVFKKNIFDYIEGDNIALEQEPMKRLVEQKQLTAYKHGGFWHCMDTYRDFQLLNKMWNEGKAPWKVWQ